MHEFDVDFGLAPAFNPKVLRVDVEVLPGVIGECKSRGEITDDDVRKLTRVANVFPTKRIEPYIIVAKTSEFTPDEVERCKAAQDRYRQRVILLSERELEPYFIYEKTQKQFNIRSTAISFDDLAKATHHIYFDPKQK